MLGPFGALAGMIVANHKTRKWGFWIRVIACCALHGYLSIQVISKKYELLMKGRIEGLETQMPEMNDNLYPEPSHKHNEL